MKVGTVRKIVLACVVLAAIVGLIWHTGTGTVSSFGVDAIASICPLGALETMIADRALIPRAVVAVVVAIVLGALLGKVFCGWICPVPPLRRFLRPGKRAHGSAAAGEDAAAGEGAGAAASADAGAQVAAGEGVAAAGAGAQAAAGASAAAPLSEGEKSLLAGGCATSACSPAACASCPTAASIAAPATKPARRALDGRHVVLLGALGSTAVFGFPVFCLVCPVGLVFATIVAYWRLVGFNEVTLSLIVFPCILLLELLVLRKWCHRFCPLGALMSLLALPNRLLRPRVKASTCLRSRGIDCTACVQACPEGLDPHRDAGMHECTKCGACRDACPAHAISFTGLPVRRDKDGAAPAPKAEQEA